MKQVNSRFYLLNLIVASLLGFSIFSPLFCVPPMEYILTDALSISHAQASLLFTGPILMMVVMAIPAGLVADRIGVKKAAGIGAVMIAVGALLRSMASDYYGLLAFSLILGIGIGWAFPNLPKLVSAWTPREKAGITTGIYSGVMLAGAALATAITVPVVLPLTNTFQGVFLIWSIAPIISAALCWIIIKEPHRNKTLSNSTALLAQVLKNKWLWRVAILLLLHNIYLYTLAGWAPLLLQQKGATPSLAGIIASLILWVGVPTAIFMPRLAFRLGVRKPFLWGPGIILALAAWGAMNLNLSVIWLLFVLIGVTNVTRFNTILALPIEMMPAEKVGAASGLIFSIGYIGAIIGPLMGGYILDITGSLDILLFMLVGISVVTVGIALSLPDTGTRKVRR